MQLLHLITIINPNYYNSKNLNSFIKKGKQLNAYLFDIGIHQHNLINALNQKQIDASFSHLQIKNITYQQ